MNDEEPQYICLNYCMVDQKTGYCLTCGRPPLPAASADAGFQPADVCRDQALRETGHGSKGRASRRHGVTPGSVVTHCYRSESNGDTISGMMFRRQLPCCSTSFWRSAMISTLVDLLGNFYVNNDFTHFETIARTLHASVPRRSGFSAIPWPRLLSNRARRRSGFHFRQGASAAEDTRQRRFARSNE